jgi:hypothetical protein
MDDSHFGYKQKFQTKILGEIINMEERYYSPPDG